MGLQHAKEKESIESIKTKTYRRRNGKESA